MASPSAVRAKAGTSDQIFELRASLSRKRIGSLSNAHSDLWLYNGQSPGPEIRVRKGERVRVRFFNDLEEPSTVHWHGIRIENAMDGVPGLTQDAVLSGEHFDYDFTAPDAGTYWYHAHNHSWAQVGRGLYGPLIVDESEPVAVIEDHTFVLDDWRLDETGSLLTDFDEYMREKQFGRVGNTITVNGLPMGERETLSAGKFHRIRLINAANARIFRLRVRDLNARVIALDGQNLEEQQVAEELLLAPAQRTDLIVRLGSGKTGLIEDADGALSLGLKDEERAVVISYQVSNEEVSATDAFPRLQTNVLPEPDLKTALHVPLVMEGGSLSSIGTAFFRGKSLGIEELAAAKQVWKFNGTANLPSEPLFRIERGRSVVIDMQNRTGFEHAMHVHGHHFKVVNSDERLGPWRDTSYMASKSSQSIAFNASNPGKWLFHCHMLEHAAAGMRSWFEVV